MNATLRFSPQDVLPTRERILDLLRIPRTVTPSAAVERLCAAALERLPSLMAPRAMLAEISQAEFARVYEGRGANAERSPLEIIYPQARHLALFAVTLGEAITAEIRNCFDTGDAAFGAMLDAGASTAADRLAAAVELEYARRLADASPAARDWCVLRYSPGYCGWHVSAQPRLFAHLGPDAIGIELRESCLMDPLKSITGVLVAGPRAIHEFEDAYEFCERCEDRGCRARIAGLRTIGERL